MLPFWTENNLQIPSLCLTGYFKQLCFLTLSHCLWWAFSLSLALMLCSHFEWSERQLMLHPASLLCWRGPTHDQRVGWESSCGIVSQHSLPTYATTLGWMNPLQTIVTHSISKELFVCFHRLIQQTSKAKVSTVCTADFHLRSVHLGNWCGIVWLLPSSTDQSAAKERDRHFAVKNTWSW